MDLPLAVLPPRSTHTHTIIFLHGRGDTAANMAETLFWSRSSPSRYGPAAAAAAAQPDSLEQRLTAKYGRTLNGIFPGVRWVFPQTPKRPCERLNGSPLYQWFDVWNMLDFEDREELQIPGLADSVASIRKLVWDEAWALGDVDMPTSTYDDQPTRTQSIRAKYKRGLRRVVLAGISQGGATAAHSFINLGEIPLRGVGMPITPESDISEETASISSKADNSDNAPLRLAGVIAFSAHLPFPGGTLAETREVLGYDEPCRSEGREDDQIVHHTPILLEHCVDDPKVFVDYGRQLRESLRSFGCRRVEWIEYADGGHWINAPKGIDDVAMFLKKQGLEEAV